MESMSCNTEGWPRSAVSIPSAKTTNLKLQAETERSRYIYISNPCMLVKDFAPEV